MSDNDRPGELIYHWSSDDGGLPTFPEPAPGLETREYLRRRHPRRTVVKNAWSSSDDEATETDQAIAAEEPRDAQWP